MSSSKLNTLLRWRTRFAFGPLEAIILALYTGILGVTIPHHEPWVDEAQAWLIARDNSIWQILRYRLHYEGHPGLWHVLLHLFQQLGGRYAAIDYFGAAFAIVGMAVFLRFSPFPLLLRVLMPFTFFFQYQYAVIARSYSLFPLLAFALCALFYRRQSAIWFCLVAGLLCNVSIQGAVYSFVLVALYLYQRLAQPQVADLPLASRVKTFTIPVLLYVAFVAVAAFAAAPAPDTGIANGGPVMGGSVARLLAVYPGTLPLSEYLPPLPKPRHEAPPPEPVRPSDQPPAIPSALHHPALWAADFSNRDRVDANNNPLARTNAQTLLKTAIELLSLATAPIATIKLLALCFLTVLVLWLHRMRMLRMLLPWLFNLLVGEVLWIADHHLGILFLALLTAIWLSISNPKKSPTPQPRLTSILILSLAAVAILQIAWSAASIRRDIHQPYDPGPETARWLLDHPHPTMAAFGFVATGVQPYYAANPFFNLRRSYYIWAVGHNADVYHFAVLEQKPSLVLFSQDLLEPGFTHNDWAPLSRDGTATQNHDLALNPIIQDLKQHGYRETHRFCGDRFFRFSASYRACNLIFEPAPNSSPTR